MNDQVDRCIAGAFLEYFLYLNYKMICLICFLFFILFGVILLTFSKICNILLETRSYFRLQGDFNYPARTMTVAHECGLDVHIAPNPIPYRPFAEKLLEPLNITA